MYSTEFTFAVARVKAMESKLLDHTEVERMLGADSARETYKILNDLTYATHIGDIENVGDFQTVITAGLTDAKMDLESICPDSRVLDFIYIRYDFHNIKTILKGMLSEKSMEEIEAQLLPLGRVPVEALIRFFTDKEYPFLPLPDTYVEVIKVGIAAAKKLYEANDQDPRLLDLALDQTLTRLQSLIAAEINNPFITEFAQTSVDLNNIKTLLRVKWLKQEAYFAENKRGQMLFAHGGNLGTHKFKEAMDADISQIGNIFQGSGYEDLMAKGHEAFERFRSFVYLEKFADELLMAIAKSSTFHAFGPAALIGYSYAKQNNAQVIRMIMVGKLNGLSDEVLRERLATLYV